MARLPNDPVDGHPRSPAVRRWSGALVLTLVVGSAVSTGALAVAAGPLRLGSAAASRQPSPEAIPVKVRHVAWSARTATQKGGHELAQARQAHARAELRSARPRGSRSLARDIARHLAAGNPEVARYAIPYDVYRATGCRVGFASATIDPDDERAVQAEKEGRGSRVAQARGSFGRDAVAHAAEPTGEGLKVHVIVTQMCPARTGT